MTVMGLRRGGRLGWEEARLRRRSRLQARRGLCLPASAGRLYLPRMRLSDAWMVRMSKTWQGEASAQQSTAVCTSSFIDCSMLSSQ